MSRHAIEVFDDRGTSMMDARISTDRRLSGKSKNSIDFDLNVDLEDGYYVLQAKIVSVGPGNVPFNATAETFLEVIEGEKTVISRKDFYNNSLHNVAIQEKG